MDANQGLDELASIIRSQKPRFRIAFFLSFVGGLMLLAPMAYMFEVYGRVVESRSLFTLGMLFVLLVWSLAVTLGFLLGSLMMVLVARVMRRASPSRVDRWFRRLQLVSAGAYSLGHGGNDAQKTIGAFEGGLGATNAAPRHLHT